MACQCNGIITFQEFLRSEKQTGKTIFFLYKKEEEERMGSTTRIDRLLANLGYCSRRSALVWLSLLFPSLALPFSPPPNRRQSFIRRNEITLGGEPLKSLDSQVPKDGAGISVNGKPLLDPKPYRLSPVPFPPFPCMDTANRPHCTPDYTSFCTSPQATCAREKKVSTKQSTICSR